ncbi:MAG: anti-phage dCTP deaminase [Tabrizicola sp.]
MSKPIPKPETCPELVFGLVGPIGVNIDAVQECLISSLKQVNYTSKVVHISKLVEAQQSKKLKPKKGQTKLEMKISQANAFCSVAEDGSALAGLAILEILKLRKSANIKQGLPEAEHESARQHDAYIIRQLKRQAEVELLRTVYGEKFVQISISLDKPSRVRRLTDRISRDHPNMALNDCENHARRLVEIDEDERSQSIGATKAFGQEVGEIFHKGDFFINTAEQSKVPEKVSRFVHAFFGDNSVSPTKDEFGTYMAAAAALRSADLSRQVGSAIFSSTGDVLALGCNEVPRAGGGNYWYEDLDKYRDIEVGAEQNSIEKQRIITDFLDRLKSAGLIDSSVDFDDQGHKDRLSEAIDEALISDITEYGRMTHAEMSAICDAARLGRPIGGSTIYVTTFPCHNCAKHIVAAGIKKVIYIEPYPKSRAERSHPDSISMDTPDLNKVVFEHFEGISPRRYQSIFQKGRRRKGSEVQKWYGGEERPRISELDYLHTEREKPYAALSLQKIRKKGASPTS